LAGPPPETYLRPGGGAGTDEWSGPEAWSERYDRRQFMRDADNIPRTQFPTNERQRRPASVGEVGGGPLGSLPINERSYRRVPEPPEVIRMSSQPVERLRDDDEPGFVIHLPIRVPDLASATVLAGRVAESLGFLPELDAGETTVSNADDQ